MIDLNPAHLAIVERILAEHVPECEVRAFGSRATWNAKDYSDLDLAIIGGDEPLPRGTVARLKEAFEESPLPMRVDVVDWHAIADGFRESIESDCVVMQQAASPSGGWRETTLGEFAPFRYGKSLPASTRNPSGWVPVLGSNGVVGHHDSALTDGPTVIIGRKGTAGAIHYSPVPCWPIDTTFFVTGSDAELVRFKYYALGALGLDGMNTDSAVPGLNRSAAHARDVRVPEEQEQRAIARVLGALDDKIELNRRMSETLEGMARALFQSWFVDFDPVRAKAEGRPSGLPPDLDALFPASFEASELGEIPAGWELKALGEIVELAYGKALRAQDRRLGTTPVYGSNGQVGWHDEKLVDGPGIVVGRKGNPGLVRWVPTDFYPIDTTFYVVPRESTPGVHFLFYALEWQNLPSIAADSAVPGLNRNLAYMSRQVVPPGPIVEHFTDSVGDTLARSHCLNEEARTLAMLRDVLLPRLVSGEFRVGTRS